MFDFGFSELVVVFVVALVVLGPTRLPGLVRKVGRWIGKARAMANDFRQQLENEVNLEELNRMTERQSQQRTAATPDSPADSPAPPGASAETPADAGLSGTGYPYGTPTDVGSADEQSAAAPSPGDDTWSHAHAEGAAPQPWSPEAEVVTADHDTSPEPAPVGEPHTSDPAAPGTGKQDA